MIMFVTVLDINTSYSFDDIDAAFRYMKELHNNCHEFTFECLVRRCR